MNRDRMWSVRLELREAVLRWDAPLTQFSSPSYPELFSGVSPTFPASQHVSASVPPPLPGSQLLDDPILPSLPREEYPFTFNTFGVDVQPARFTRGSYHYNLATGKYTMKWASVTEMQQWIRAEEKAKTIELHRKEHRKNRWKKAPAWTSKHILYLQPARLPFDFEVHEGNRSGPTKRILTGCQCRLTVKTYPGMEEVLGRYTQVQGHIARGPRGVWGEVSDDVDCHFQVRFLVAAIKTA
ncbi:hypothetical protein B0H13DRAFT_2379724 [Mycena leptocephala]|nr:hypothetical protein B0H13DRAFT_2379724 [Mycena leptocephala]